MTLPWLPRHREGRTHCLPESPAFFLRPMLTWKYAMPWKRSTIVVCGTQPRRDASYVCMSSER